MVFKKELMINRVTKEGRAHLLDEATMKIMDNLDGCEASSSCWQRVVCGKPVFWVVGKNGVGEYVNELDCV